MNTSRAFSTVSRSLGAMVWLVLLAVAPINAHAADGRYILEFGGIERTSELSLSIGKSQIIYSPADLDQVVIGSPEIADIKLLSSRQVLILGQKPGRTNLVFRDKQRSLIAVIDVVVGYDLDGIKRKMHEALPDQANIQVRGQNDAVMLSGEVSSLLAMDTALAVARSYVPEKKVVNMLQVGGSQQVMLEVKVSEVNRSSARQLGVRTSFTGDNAAGRTYSIITGAASATAFGTATYNSTATSVADVVSLTLQALETKGLAKILAEPNLVALSGQEASFLAGGEFPVAVAQTSGVAGPTITVEFKEFGVGLKFVPTVLGRDKINLKLNTEVSAIDNSTTVGVGGGITIPAVTTRRAGTTVEVADGQSFAIAGLMQSNMSNAVNQFPALGDIPILGALFRSTDFQRDETELVIVVTPRLVRPVPGQVLALPTDNVVPPNALDQYLLGRLQGVPSNKAVVPVGGAAKEGEAAPSGVEGNFGHEL